MSPLKARRLILVSLIALSSLCELGIYARGQQQIENRLNVGNDAKSTPSPAAATAPAPSPKAENAKTSSTATEPPRQSVKSAAAELPLERQPYRILVHLACSPLARIDEGRRSELLKNWQVLTHSYVGAPWVLSIAPESSPNGKLEPRTLKPEMLTNIDGFDKVWLIHVDRSATGGGLEISGREYDAATRQIGPLLVRKTASTADAARALFRFTLDLFNPTALIAGQSGGRALLNVRGLLIEPASPIGAVVKRGTVFAPMRLLDIKGKVQVRRIIFTYLQVEAIEGAIARCAIISGFRDPLTQRMLTPNTLAAVGIKPGNSPSRLRFDTVTQQFTRPGEARRPPIIAPAAGYLLTARSLPDGQPRELGLTDRAGRIVLQPGFADGLVMLRLLAGNVEPMVELALMPGETEEERPINFTPRPDTVALEAELESLKDEVLDLVALRKRLEARMKARLEGEDWDGLQGAIKDYAKLTPRDELAKRLAALKEDATKRNQESRVGILTKTAQAQINDMQSMIDGYLEDDTVRSYADALDRSRADKAGTEKTKTSETPKPKPTAAAPSPTAGSDKPPAAPAPKPKPAPAPSPF